MNTIETTINGQPWKIVVEDGAEVIIEGNKITVRGKPAAPVYVQGPAIYIDRYVPPAYVPPPQIDPWNPWVYPTITWDGVRTDGSEFVTAFTLGGTTSTGGEGAN
jgi:hypothetical protein